MFKETGKLICKRCFLEEFEVNRLYGFTGRSALNGSFSEGAYLYL